MRMSSTMEVTVRDADERDAEAVQAIYAHHVLHGTASYDTEPPSSDSIREKVRGVLAAGWPYLVAEVDGQIAGYAYATRFRDRAAYQYTCENSIYVDPDRIGRGIGRALLQALIERSAAADFRTMIAVIGGAEPASVRLHSSCGFAEVGRLRAVGFKFGRWLDLVLMQRILNHRTS